MSIPATAPSLDLLDRLMAADEVWAHSAEDGRAVAEHILASQAAIVLLYGPARAASTAFMQRWVIPPLSQWKRVSYVAAGEPISFDDGPDAGTGIRIFDGFEHHLAEGGSPTETMRRLAAATATSGTGKLVLVLQEDYLSRLFMAREVVPTILDDVFAIPTMPADKFVEALERTAATLGVAIDDGFVAALTRDLDAVRTRATLVPELVAILAFELYRSSGGAARPLTREDYDARDDLGGILAGHIDFLLESLPAGASADIGWAVLQEVVRTGIGAPTDLVDVANRFDVAVDAPLAVAAWLEADRRVLRANNEGGHDVVPALLARGVEYHARRMAEAIEHTRSQLCQAARQDLEFHALPPEPTFRRINAQRSALVVADDEARLMLRCALAYNGDNSDALHHWLRRVTSETAAVEILLDALFDSRADVRVRAARCLGRFNSQDVRDQLHLIALRDTVPAVRAAAVDSLQNIATPALRSALTRETLDPNSPYRLQAIDALRIFRDDRTVTTLVKIVDEVGPGHEEEARLRAIDVLGTHDTPQAVGALARIAVHDPDAADWEAAAKALGTLQTVEAAGIALDAVDAERRAVPGNSRTTFPPALIADGAAGALAVALMIGTLFLNGLILFVVGRRRTGIVLTVLGMAALASGFAEVPILPALWLAHGPARIPDTAASPARRALRRRAADAAAAGARHPAVRRRLRDGVRPGAWTLVGDGAKDQAGPGHHHVPGGGELPVLQLAPPRRGRPRRLQRRGAVPLGRLRSDRTDRGRLCAARRHLRRRRRHDVPRPVRVARPAGRRLARRRGLPSSPHQRPWLAGADRPGRQHVDRLGRRRAGAGAALPPLDLRRSRWHLERRSAAGAGADHQGDGATPRRAIGRVPQARVQAARPARPHPRRPRDVELSVLDLAEVPAAVRQPRRIRARDVHRRALGSHESQPVGADAGRRGRDRGSGEAEARRRIRSTSRLRTREVRAALEPLTRLAQAEDPKLATPALTSLQLVLQGEVKKLQGPSRGAPFPQAQRDVLDALPRGGTTRVEDTISELLRDSREAATRQKAIDALQRLGSRAAVERLRRFAESPPEAPHR